MYYNINSENVGVLDLPVVPVVVPSFRRLQRPYFAESRGRLFYGVPISGCALPPYYYIYELDNVSMEWSDARVECLESCEHFGFCRMGQETSIMAVSRREDEDDEEWDFVFSLTMPTTNCLIIANSTLGRRVLTYDGADFYNYRSCQYVPSLAPI